MPQKALLLSDPGTSTMCSCDYGCDAMVTMTMNSMLILSCSDDHGAAHVGALSTSTCQAWS